MVTKGEFIATMALSNGMIGGIILVIPLLGIITGYLLIPLTCILFGSISCYTCYLIILHLGKCSNIRDSILQHFYNSHIASVVYSSVIIMSILGGLINYFNLIVLQVEGFIDPSPYIGITMLFVLIILTSLMKVLDFGEKLMAIGMTSIITYCLFLIWAQITAPTGSKSVIPIGQNIDLSASLIMGYAIHDFVSQILIKSTTPDKYVGVVISTYILAVIIYTFITYGCFAIINREQQIEDPQIIVHYFVSSGWQIKLIQIIYLFHLLTASPQICIILRIRILQIFKIDDSPKLTVSQFIIYSLIYGICYLLYALGLKTATIMEINGSLIGVTYIFLVPICVHIKCVYFSKHDQKGFMISEQFNDKGETIEYYGNCGCRNSYRNNFTKYFELFILITIVIIGFMTVVYTMKNLFFTKQEIPSTIIIETNNNKAIIISSAIWPRDYSL